ncbi:hypothetical protein EVAR_41637_1 [Eumeta japonica]|uniref:Uncharacterized protein n=1 Tax=Eumeta variegata TaxID=151549 RepID=A0A4C1WZI2_EUMVA|nr:hypothetical protein EVAR_41637_1 [Eumeta japonica]
MSCRRHRTQSGSGVSSSLVSVKLYCSRSVRSMLSASSASRLLDEARLTMLSRHHVLLSAFSSSSWQPWSCSSYLKYPQTIVAHKAGRRRRSGRAFYYSAATIGGKTGRTLVSQMHLSELHLAAARRGAARARPAPATTPSSPGDARRVTPAGGLYDSAQCSV